MSHHVRPGAMARVVRLYSLMMLAVGLMGVASLLLEVVQCHGHVRLSPWRAIEPGVVALLVTRAVHPSTDLALGALCRGSGRGSRISTEMAEQVVQ